MPATDFFEQLVLKHALLQQPFSVTSWYVGLWTADPTSAGLLSDEVQAGDYSRKSVTWDSSFSNSNLIQWNASSDWGNITYVVVLNKVANGNALVYQSRSTLDINPGTPVEIPVGGLTVSLT